MDQVDAIDGALGELSQFFQTHGFYVHGLPIDAVTLPTGWRDRVVTVRNSATYDYSGLCLEAHDLAASKLAAFRDKDREFVRVLLSERLINAATLTARLGSIEMAETERARRVQWVSLTATALDDTS